MTTPVFVSSTFSDLREHRAAVSEVIRKLGAVDVAMEYMGARDERPLDECLRMVRAESQLFVGVYAPRYGFVPDASDSSITELEYCAASDAGLPRLMFLVDDNAAWRPADIERGDGEAKLLRFKQRVKSHHVCEFFSTADDLAKRVAASLGRELARRSLRSVNGNGGGQAGPVEAQNPQSIADWEGVRNGEYGRCRGVFLVHTLSPASTPNQLFDIQIYLLRHQSDDFSDVVEAEFFLGRYWNNQVFRVANEGGLIGIRVSAYGPFLCVCRVGMRDGTEIVVQRYIDFEAARVAR